MDIKTITMKNVMERARILDTNRLEPVIAASGIRQNGAGKENEQKIHGGMVKIIGLTLRA